MTWFFGGYRDLPGLKTIRVMVSIPGSRIADNKVRICTEPWWYGHEELWLNFRLLSIGIFFHHKRDPFLTMIAALIALCGLFANRLDLDLWGNHKYMGGKLDFYITGQ